MPLRINNFILKYLLGGLLGLISALVFLHLFHTLEMREMGHSFLYHWFQYFPPTHALSIILGFILTGFLMACWITIEDQLKIQKAETKALEEISRAKTEMVSFVSHQMRTPLAGLKFSIKMLLEGEFGRLTEDQQATLTKTYKASEDLGNLIQDFLDISKLEIGKLEISLKNVSLLNLEKTIKEVIENFEPKLKEKNITLNHSSFLNKQLSIAVDLRRVKQIVENLLENAIDYTPKDGKIGIALTSDKNNFKFRIFDTGVGISKREQSKIFSKFFRATNARKLQSTGTGLGLYLCKKFIEGHQGKIWFESEEGKGTTFSFTLPLKTKVEIEELFRKI